MLEYVIGFCNSSMQIRSGLCFVQSLLSKTSNSAPSTSMLRMPGLLIGFFLYISSRLIVLLDHSLNNLAPLDPLSGNRFVSGRTFPRLQFIEIYVKNSFRDKGLILTITWSKNLVQENVESNWIHSYSAPFFPIKNMCWNPKRVCQRRYQRSFPHGPKSISRLSGPPKTGSSFLIELPKLVKFV